MRIAVVGAGAMGSLFGALLAETGTEVCLYDVWIDHINAINQSGLRIEHQNQTRTVSIHATADPNQIGRADLAIIFVKSTQTAPATRTAAQLLGTDGLILTLQNGMGNADIMAQFIDPARIVAGTTAHGATVLGPGRIRHAGSGPTVIGLWAPGEGAQTLIQPIAARFTQAGIETEVVADVRPVVWNKLLVNVGINAITALTGIKNGQLLDLAATREVSRAAVEEARSVAQARGVQTRGDAVAHVFQIAEATALNRSSMGQDVDARRPTEIDAINGFIVREARQLGLPVPVNQTLTALIETLQFHYE
ncbi:MAG: 2-dehydropantoate 2-reductase [Desulfobacterales bacterium]|nr:MAG: 2-dehydropantoate 2-reductase [Desulfobacterales bacterium]